MPKVDYETLYYNELTKKLNAAEKAKEKVIKLCEYILRLHNYMTTPCECQFCKLARELSDIKKEGECER